MILWEAEFLYFFIVIPFSFCIFIVLLPSSQNYIWFCVNLYFFTSSLLPFSFLIFIVLLPSSQNYIHHLIYTLWFCEKLNFFVFLCLRRFMNQYTMYKENKKEKGNNEKVKKLNFSVSKKLNSFTFSYFPFIFSKGILLPPLRSIYYDSVRSWISLLYSLL